MNLIVAGDDLTVSISRKSLTVFVSLSILIVCWIEANGDFVISSPINLAEGCPFLSLLFLV